VAFLRDPDYAFVTTAESINILLFELESLLIQGGVYISVHNYIQNEDDWTRQFRGNDKMIMVLYFDDSVLDLMAEI